MIALPLKVNEFPEAFRVTDTLDRRLAHVYFNDGPDVRFRLKCDSNADAQEIAVMTAVAFGAKFEQSAPP